MQPEARGSWAETARTLFVVLALLGIGAMIPAIYESARVRLPGPQRPPGGGAVASSAPPAASPVREQVTVTQHSSDIPGCHPEGRLFRTVVESQWRDKHSVNEIEYRWRRADTTGGDPGYIDVRVAGQVKVATVKVGEALPKLTIHLPIEPAPLSLKLNTLVFERWSDDGQACFIWESPPDTPRPYDAEPIIPGTT